MALLLSIDTSTRGCSVALHRDTQLLVSYDLLAERSSSGMLTTLIQNALQHADIEAEQLSAVAVAKGPGSYTGLRIAVSTAKGFCYALDKPLISIETLAAMTLQVRDFYEADTLFCPMIDARRMEVFCTVLDTTLKVIAPTQAKIIDGQSFEEILSNHKVVFFGDGAAKCAPVLSFYPNAVILKMPIYPSAATVGLLAYEKYNQGVFEELATFEPYYLKEFVGTTPRGKT